MSGILGGNALGGVGVGDWLYTLRAGLYSGGVAGCWLCTLRDVACWLLRSVESTAIREVTALAWEVASEQF